MSTSAPLPRLAGGPARDDQTAVWASVSRVQSLIALGRVAEAAAVMDGVSVEPAHDPGAGA